MKLSSKILSLAAVIAATTFSVRADTAGLYDLVVGFKQNGATNDVVIDLGNINNYAAAGTYVIGNYDSVLGSNFGNSWNASTTVNWGAAATWKDEIEFALPTRNWVTSQWGTAQGTLGIANSIAWLSNSDAPKNNFNFRLNKVYAGLAAYTVGSAETISTAHINSWKTATTLSASAFSVYGPQSRFQNQPARLANGEMFSASDLYLIGNSFSIFGEPTETKFVGTLALYQNGDLTFTVIPEPSTYAAIFGVAALGLAVLRRRKQYLVA